MIATVLFVTSVAGAVVAFSGTGEKVGSLASVFTELKPLQAPGETTVTIEEGSEQAIYRQIFSAGGTVPGGDAGTKLDCDVLDPSGNDVALGVTVVPTTLSLNRSEYITEFTFEAPESGVYEVGCTTRGGTPALLQVGPTVEFGEIFGAIGGVLAGIGLLLLGFLVAIAIALPVWLMRLRHKKRLQDERIAIGQTQ
ncbi:MAG: hypothetical protein ACR2OC_01500 [Solirubrobacterales bacterium]